MAARRIEAVVSGKVQTVGFRDRVQEVALQLGVSGEIRNLPDRRVALIAEAEPPVLERFIEEIAKPHGFIRVEAIERRKEGPARGMKPPFRIRRGPMADELGERLDQGVVYLQAIHKDLVQEIRQGAETVGAKVDQVGAKVDQVGAKVDQVGAKVDQVGAKVDGLGVKLDSVGASLGQKIDSMHVDMNLRFDRLDEKYGLMSQGVAAALERQDRMLDELARLRQEFLAAQDRHAAQHAEALRELRDAIRERRV
jgi:acylphosphatase